MNGSGLDEAFQEVVVRDAKGNRVGTIDPKGNARYVTRGATGRRTGAVECGNGGLCVDRARLGAGLVPLRSKTNPTTPSYEFGKPQLIQQKIPRQTGHDIGENRGATGGKDGESRWTNKKNRQRNQWLNSTI